MKDLRFGSALWISCIACASALRAGVTPPPMHRVGTSRTAPALLPALCQQRSAAVNMQMQLDPDSKAFFEGFVETDPVTGESKQLSLGEKEKLYLECLDAYYNEGGKQLLGDSDYNQLKIDINFEGSRVATFSADEIKFVLANKRYKMGKPMMSDSEYDALRARLRSAFSPVVIREGAKCSVEDGICKNDMAVDSGKTRLLYLPGTIGASLLLSEIFFWTLHIDPLLSLILGALPAYVIGVLFTENIFAQKPLVIQAACPNCGTVNTIFFGDLFRVMTDGYAGPPNPPGSVVQHKCTNCNEELTANREKMLVTTTFAKGNK